MARSVSRLDICMMMLGASILAAGLGASSAYATFDNWQDPQGLEIVFDESSNSTSAPQAPQDLHATTSANSVTLTWEEPDSPDIVGYDILRKTIQSDRHFRIIHFWNGTVDTDTTFVDTNVMPGLKFAYRVAAVMSDGSFAESKSVRVKVLPRVPENLDAVAAPGSVTLTWDEPDDQNIIGYNILRKPTKHNEVLQLIRTIGNTSVTNFVDTDVTQGIKYAYRVEPLAAHGDYARSEVVRIAVPPKLPENLGAVATSDSVTLTWDEPDDQDIIGYKILRKRAMHAEYLGIRHIINDTSGVNNTFVDADVATGIKYVYIVLPFSSEGTYARSEVVKITVPPKLPENLRATVTNGSVTLTWDDPDDQNIIGYNILRRATAEQSKLSVIAGGIGNTNNTFVDNNVTADTRYAYRVIALSAEGEYARSESAVIKTPPPVLPPITKFVPEGLEATATTDSVTLTWENLPFDDITGHKIFRKLADKRFSAPLYVGDTQSADAGFTDTNVTVGQTYLYRISAISEAGESKKSNAASAFVPLPVPEILDVTAASGSVILTWDDPGYDGITGYKVFRRTSDLTMSERNPTTPASDYSVYTQNTDTVFVDRDAVAGAVSVYRVAAVGATGESARSDFVRIGVPVPSLQNLTATATSDNVTLVWDDQGDGSIVGYDILRRAASDEHFITVRPWNSTSGINSTFVDTGVTAGATYTYHVMAVNTATGVERSGAITIQVPRAGAPADSNATSPAPLSPPVAPDIFVNTTEDTPVTATSRTFIITAVTNGTNGTAVHNGTEITYIPDPDYNGYDAINYTVTDYEGQNATGTMYITITPVNDPPVLYFPGDIDMLAGDSINFTVTATDPDNDPLVFNLTHAPTGAEITQDGFFSWTTDSDDGGEGYLIGIHVSDLNGGTAFESFVILVFNPNQTSANVTSVPPLWPVAPDIFVNTTEDTPVTVTPDLSNFGTDTITFVNATLGNVTTDGTAITYVPELGYSGLAVIDYISYEYEGLNVTGTIYITITPVSGAPVDNPATIVLPPEYEDVAFIIIPEGQRFTFDINVTGHDDAGYGLNFTLDPPVTGARITPEGVFSWTPAEEHGPGTHTFTITVYGDRYSASRAITFIVTEVNRAPGINNYWWAETVAQRAVVGETLMFNVSAHDTDIPRQTLTFNTTGQPAGSAIINTVTEYGRPGSFFSWTPNASQTGEHTITITVSDEYGASSSMNITIHVTDRSAGINPAPANTPPVFDTYPPNMIVTAGYPLDFNVWVEDADGDPLIFNLTEGPEDATITRTTEYHKHYEIATFEWTPDDGDIGNHTVVITASDRQGQTDSLDIIIAVTASNPVSANQPAPQSPPYIPYAGYNGYDMIYMVTRDEGVEPNIYVNAIEDVPVTISLDVQDRGNITGITAVTNGRSNIFAAGEAVIVYFTDRDYDRHDMANYTVTNGISSISASGPAVITYTPDRDYNGHDTINYTITKDENRTVTGTIVINVAPVNDPPEFLYTPYYMSVDTIFDLNFTVWANDADGDDLIFNITDTSAPVTWHSYYHPANYTVATFTWAPPFLHMGDHAFNITVSDGQGGTDSQLVVLNVTNPDLVSSYGQPVIALPPEYEDVAFIAIPEDQWFTFDINVTGLDDARYFTLDPPVAGARITQEGRFSWTPTGDQGPGVYTFDIVASDGPYFVSRSITIVVVDANQTLVANDYAVHTMQDTPITINVLGNNTIYPVDTWSSINITKQGAMGSAVAVNGSVTYTPDQGATGTDTVSYVIVTVDDISNEAVITIMIAASENTTLVAPDIFVNATEDTPVTIVPEISTLGGGAATILFVNSTVGTATTNGTAITYVPAPGYTGPDVIGYIAANGEGQTDEGFIFITVTLPQYVPIFITVTPQYVQPTIVLPPEYEDVEVIVIPEGQRLTFDINVTGLDNARYALNSTLDLQAAGARITQEGVFSWTPTGEHGPGTYMFYVTAYNGTYSVTKDITIIVVGENHAPVLDYIADLTVAVGDTLWLVLTATDVDDQLLTFALDTAPAGATITTTGVFSWTPADSQVGGHNITVTVHDGRGGADSQDVVITVLESTGNGTGADNRTAPIAITDSNRSPTAPDIPASARPGTPTLITLEPTDPDGDDITITNVTGSTKGTIKTGALDVGRILYTPGSDQSGIDTIFYTVSDGRGGTDNGTITVYINEPGNTAPVLDMIHNTGINAGRTLTFAVAAIDADDDPLIFRTDNVPPNGTITSYGNFSWTPTGSQVGIHTITITAHDGRGGADWQQVAVTVYPEDTVNHNPTAPDARAVVEQGDIKAIKLDMTDRDGDPVRIVSIDGATKGTILQTSVSNDLILYIAHSTLGTDIITYVVTDDRGGIATGTISVTVIEPVNISPTLDLIGDRAINALQTLTFTATATDIDSTTLTFGLENEPAGSTITPQGAFSWTPSNLQVGRHNVTVTVSDDAGGLDSEVITIIVKPLGTVNALPLAPDIAIAASQDTPSIIRPDIADPDDDPVRITTATGNTKGEIITGFLRAGIMLYRPNTGQTGIETINYTVSDGSASATATMSIFINENDNRNPILAPIGFRNINTGDTLSFAILSISPDGNALSYMLIGGPADATISEQGDFSWAPTAADVGNHTFTIAIYDGQGGSDSEVVTVRVLPAGTPNEPPIAPSIAATMNTNSSTIITPEIGDPDGDQVFITDVTDAARGTVLLLGDDILYIATDELGADTITYTVTDTRGATSTGTITVIIQ